MTEFLHDMVSDPGVIQEIINGMWFILGVEIVIALLIYLGRTARDRDCDVLWLYRIHVQISIAIILFVIGSTTRAYWVWALWECRNRTNTMCADHFTSPATLIFSATMAVFGGLLIIRSITTHWSRWLWVPAIIIALIVPMYTHFW